ncbi:hypothetical protein ES703_03254 [subsurface metagenome]
MNAVGAPHHNGMLVRHRLLLQHRDELGNVLVQDVCCRHQLQAERSVYNIGGCQPEVNEATLLPQALRHRADEGGHIVVRSSKYLIDAFNTEAGVFYLGESLLGNSP